MPNEISFSELVTVLKKRYLLILAPIILACIIAIIYVKTTPKIYRAESVILPMGAGGGGGLASIMSQVAGGSMLAGPSLPSKKILLALQSRTFSLRVIKRITLESALFPEIWDTPKGAWKSGVKTPPDDLSKAEALSGRIKYQEDTINGSVKVAVELRDPVLAAEANNVILEELKNYMNEHSLDQSKKYRIYLEEQLITNRKEYIETGKEITDFYKKHHISPTSALVNVPLGSDIFRHSPDALTTVSKEEAALRLTDLKSEKEKLDALKNATVHNVPQQIYLEYLLKNKEILSATVALLFQEYEMAKMEEAREGTYFVIIDKAIVPGSPYKPQPMVVLALSIFLGAFLGIFMVVVLEFFLRDSRRRLGA